VGNALTNDSHPCQILADLLTIEEHRGGVAGKTLTFYGDGFNNVTHSLMLGGTMLGMHVRVACPEGGDYIPSKPVLAQAEDYAKASGGSVEVFHDARAASEGTNVLYTDSWMSYHIDPSLKEARIARFMPYQVTQDLITLAADDAIFMNCLPAERGVEQTAEVIDGPHSVVFDQAENRLHAQKAVMLKLLDKK
jgi:ornithine carbamoyltransferase